MQSLLFLLNWLDCKKREHAKVEHIAYSTSWSANFPSSSRTKLGTAFGTCLNLLRNQGHKYLSTPRFVNVLIHRRLLIFKEISILHCVSILTLSFERLNCVAKWRLSRIQKDLGWNSDVLLLLTIVIRVYKLGHLYCSSLRFIHMSSDCC